MMPGRVLAVGHRGARLEAPENTLASFKRAIAAGVDWLELDVHMTADGRFAVIHDDDVSRTTGGSGRVSEMPFAAVRRLDAGWWFDGDFAGERVPSLEEVVALADGKAGLLVEVKEPGDRAGDIARALPGVLEGFRGETIVGSFDPDFLWFYKRNHPGQTTALITRKPAGLRHAREAGADAVSVSVRSPAAVLIPRIKRAGKLAFVWTIGSMRALQVALHWDADAVITDFPREVRAVLDGVTEAEAADFGGDPPDGKAYLAWRRKTLRRMKPWPRKRPPVGVRG
jgi:glycerophosphoryl diester phosphodiesterase